MVARTQTLNPSKYADEEFELHSIPSFDRGTPEIAQGRVIGSTKQTVEPRDVLVSKIVPHIRRATVIPPASGRKQLASNEWIVFRHDSFDPRYLVHFLTSDLFHRQFLNTVAGVGGSLLRARPQYVRSILAPIPPLDEQRRIAAILDKADAIRQKRRQAIAHLDTLTQSIFRKMTRADKFDQSETGRFGELFKLKSGSFLPKSEQEPGEFPVYGGNGITGMHIKYLFSEPKIAIGRVGANCGAVHLTRPQSWITDNALYVDSTYRHFADEYLVFLLRSLDLNQYANRSGQPSISANRLNDIEIKIPELKVQTEFAHLANFIEAQSESHKVSLEYFESLFESLQSRAFRGEL